MLKGRYVVRVATRSEIVKIYCPVWILSYFWGLFTMNEIIVLSPFANFRFNGGLRVRSFKGLCFATDFSTLVFKVNLSSPTNEVLSISLNEVSFPRIPCLNFNFSCSSIFDYALTNFFWIHLLLHQLRKTLLAPFLWEWFYCGR